jgi:FtsH-binding integral membrane protein
MREDIAIGSVLLLPLVSGIIETFKRWWKIEGSAAEQLAILIFFVFYALSGLIHFGVVTGVWAEVLVYAVAGFSIVFGAPGLYALAQDYFRQ